tara:strand:+ start:4645 stop:5277 length:633 start_codon:yes stop_codon:yes gene_type:complete
MASLKLIESDRAIIAKIHTALAKELDGAFRKSSGKIKNRIKPIVANALFGSPEIVSLQGGVLRFDFGLTGDPGPQIVGAVVESLQIKIERIRSSSKGISGGITLSIQPSDYSNLLTLPVAMQALEIEGRVPWLEWLLFAGDSIIIAHYGVEYGAGLGRSGGAHMVSLKDAPFGPYKVNSAYSGTIDNNFITRAISKVSSEIKNTIIGALK